MKQSRRPRPLRRIPVEFLRCHADRHDWEDVTALGLWEPKVVYMDADRETDRCATCGGLRRFAWSKVTGRILTRAYKMPEGYSLAGIELPEGMTRRSAARVEWSARDRAGKRAEEFQAAVARRNARQAKAKAVRRRAS